MAAKTPETQQTSSAAAAAKPTGLGGLIIPKDGASQLRKAPVRRDAAPSSNSAAPLVSVEELKSMRDRLKRPEPESAGSRPAAPGNDMVGILQKGLDKIRVAVDDARAQATATDFTSEFTAEVHGQ